MYVRSIVSIGKKMGKFAVMIVYRSNRSESCKTLRLLKYVTCQYTRLAYWKYWVAYTDILQLHTHALPFLPLSQRCRAKLPRLASHSSQPFGCRFNHWVLLGACDVEARR